MSAGQEPTPTFWHRASVRIGAIVVALGALTGLVLNLGAMASWLPKPSVAASMAGTWSGTIQGDDPVYDLRVTLVEKDGVLTGAAYYPQLGCDGTWTMQSADTETVRFVETIPEGQRCVNEMLVTLTRMSQDTLKFDSFTGVRPITSLLLRD